MVPINYLAVIIAAIGPIVIGFLWYGPLFGSQWMHLSGMTMEKMKGMQAKGMGSTYVFMVASSLVMSYVLAHALIFASTYLQVEGPSAGLMAGFWNWLGFIAPTTLGGVLWEGKPWKLWVLNNAYWLVSLLVMGVTLAVWR